MKELLIMAKSLGGGGSEVALIELLNALPRDKYSVTLALLDDDLEYSYRLKKEVNIIKLKFRNDFYHLLVSMYSLISKVLKKLKVNSYLRYYDVLFEKVTTRFDIEYDIALDFYGYGYFLTGFLAKKVKAKKKATWLHDEKMNWIKNVEKYLPEYDKVYGVSEAVKNVFCSRLPQFKNKADVFYNVIDVDEIEIKANFSEDIPYKKNEFNILTVGRLTEQKGYDLAIETAKILKKNNIKFKWYVIGSGRDEIKLKYMVKNKKLQQMFIFLGRKNNPYPYMKHCDLYVQPSRHEGYVITLVEARSLALPILASDIPSSREQIKDNLNGYLVELNPMKIAEKIMWLNKNPEKREKVSAYLMKNKISFKDELEKLESI